MNCIIKKLLSQPSDRSPITLRCTGASLPPLLLKVRYNGIMDNLWWFVTLTSTQLSSIPQVTEKAIICPQHAAQTGNDALG